MSFSIRLAQQLRQMRHSAGWSLDELTNRCGVSRATLSRLEKAEVSPTADALVKICGAYQISMARLMNLVEDSFPPLIPRTAQTQSQDEVTGATQRQVSPPSAALSGEVIEGYIPAGAELHRATPTVPGQEHHVIILQGQMALTVDGTDHTLTPGDCLRYHANGPITFRAPKRAGVQYILVLIGH